MPDGGVPREGLGTGGFAAGAPERRSRRGWGCGRLCRLRGHVSAAGRVWWQSLRVCGRSFSAIGGVRAAVFVLREGGQRCLNGFPLGGELGQGSVLRVVMAGGEEEHLPVPEVDQQALEEGSARSGTVLAVQLGRQPPGLDLPDLSQSALPLLHPFAGAAHGLGGVAAEEGYFVSEGGTGRRRGGALRRRRGSRPRLAGDGGRGRDGKRQQGEENSVS